MALQLITVKCPECGASLNIENDREHAFCTYCGTKILIHNENEHIYRHIDEAEVKQAETDRIIRLKQMELAEKKRIDAKKNKAFKIRISLILGIVGSLMAVIGYVGGYLSGDNDSGLYFVGMLGLLFLISIILIWFYPNNEADDADFDDKAKIPASISNYGSKNYHAIEAMFVSAGFKNVKCTALNDLAVGVLKRPGMVDSITINGRYISSTMGGKKYPRDAAVIIYYHSLYH